MGTNGRTTRKEEQREATEIELLIRLDRLDMELAELEQGNKRREGCPPGWRAAEGEDPARPRKVHLTLRIDKDVARWFWQQGQGHQSRMNAVLRAYMLAKKVEMA